MNEHVTTEQILAHLDGSQDGGIIARHIEECSECSAMVAEFRQIDNALRKLPLLRTGSRLTGRVMEQVLRPPADSLSYRLLKGLAYIAPMTIVLVILGAVFSLTGVIDLQEGSTGGGRLGDTVGIVGRVSQEATSALIDLLRNYAPFMTNGESLGITFAILVVLTMLAFIDRLIGTRVGGRAR